MHGHAYIVLALFGPAAVMLGFLVVLIVAFVVSEWLADRRRAR